MSEEHEDTRSPDWCRGYYRGYLRGVVEGWNAAAQTYAGRAPSTRGYEYPRGGEEPPALPRTSG